MGLGVELLGGEGLGVQIIGDREFIVVTQPPFPVFPSHTEKRRCPDAFRHRRHRPQRRPAESEVLGASLEGGLSKSSRSRLAKFLTFSAPPRQIPREQFITAATDCHETVMVATLNIRARFERYPNSPGFSDEPGLFLRLAHASAQLPPCLGISLCLWLPPKAKPPSPFQPRAPT